ncbi:MAG: hypothetical protein ABIO70_24540 [Pseudomonadota bacterium]
MRTVHVQAPSFPEVPTETPLSPEPGRLWQVLCGDAEHWRVGVYSPAATSAAGCPELERHTCPELFLLLEGRLTLLLHDGDGVRELPLTPGQPVLVTAPHSGFCPDGAHTGRAFVVERDLFSTEYREPAAWAEARA